jgi:hypothetical protein
MHGLFRSLAILRGNVSYYYVLSYFIADAETTSDLCCVEDNH